MIERVISAPPSRRALPLGGPRPQTVGTKSVANAAPDGHTLLLSPPGPLVVAPLIYKNVGYDPAKSFTSITALFSIPQMLVVNPAVPVKSVQELIAYAKTNPGKIRFPSPGYGTRPHLLGEMFTLMAGINIIHIPYKSPAAAVTDSAGWASPNVLRKHRSSASTY